MLIIIMPKFAKDLLDKIIDLLFTFLIILVKNFIYIFLKYIDNGDTRN